NRLSRAHQTRNRSDMVRRDVRRQLTDWSNHAADWNGSVRCDFYLPTADLGGHYGRNAFRVPVRRLPHCPNHLPAAKFVAAAVREIDTRRAFMECKFLTKQAPHLFPFSHGVIVPSPGRLILLSGQVGYDRHGPDRKLVGPGDVAAQARQAFENIKTLL